MTHDERFWSHVTRTDSCWLWIGYTNKHGYGRIRRDGHNHYAHRWAYRLAFGPVDESQDVCHRCDVPACVRPDHLFLGTAKENIADCVSKGRRAMFVAERNPAAKLTWDVVREIRRDYRPREFGIDSLAKRYGVDRSLIWQVVKGRIWKETVGIQIREV